MPPKNQPVSESDIAHLHQAMGALTVKEDLVLKDASPRPGFGSVGMPIEVQANMYQVTYNKSVQIEHYDVDIQPVVKVAHQKMPKPLAQKIWAQACRDNDKAADRVAFQSSAYDLQKNVYSTAHFQLGPNRKKEIMVELPEPGREADDRRRFKVVLQHAQSIDLDSVVRFCRAMKQSTQELEIVLTAIQAINILLRQDPSQRFTPLGARGRFFGMEGATPLPNGAVVARGFMQSFRPTGSGLPAIQLDMAFTALIRPGPLIGLMPELLGLGGGGGGRGGRGGGRGGRGGRGGPPAQPQGYAGPPLTQLNPGQIKQLNKVLFGAKFTLPYKQTDRVFSVKKISVKSAAEVNFVMNGKDGEPDRNIGLIDYFKDHLNLPITKPRLPCVVYGKNFHVPIEFVKMCDFNPVPFSQQSSDQTAEMIRVTAQRPMDRATAIRQWRDRLNYSNLPKIKMWGLDVKPEPMRIKARVLPPPKVNYARSRQLHCSNGGWNLKGVSFTRPGQPLLSWGVLSLDDRFGIQDMQRFMGVLMKTLTDYGVPITNKTPALCEGRPGPGPNFPTLRAALSDACRKAYGQHKQDPQLIVIIMPRKDTALYQEIKNIAAMQLKAFVPTQCLQSQKTRGDRGMDQYCANVAMKIQAKLGGVTHEIALPSTIMDKTTMIVGADVTHPPGGRGLLQPSIACTVAGIDGDNVRFDQAVRSQEGRTEIISDLAAMMGQHIKTFERQTRNKPSKILFFRDGVSEGQYSHVCNQEVEAIRKAAHAIDKRYNPKVTFVICAKRHNMRFFPVSAQDADRTGNLKPGTVVDNQVTHPFAFDFYLQAHAGLQGTARPTHYVVIKDENRFTADNMQMLCNHLCYSYARATRAVSMVPPAYYADIIANQCRFLVYSDDDSDAATNISGATGKLATREFDPLQVDRRLRASPASKVAWYM